MNKRLSTAVIVLFLNSMIAFGQKDNFQKRIDKITQSIQAEVGIGILDLSDGRSFYNLPDAHLPMQSMFKFHLGLAVLDQVDKKKLSLDQKIQLKKSDLRPDTPKAT
jgi:beta-lactamase class A